MSPEERFARIEELLHIMADRENRMEVRFDERMTRAEARAVASERRWEKRMEAADKRMDKFDLQLQRTRALVEAGMKIVLQLAKSQRELEKSQKAFIDSLRKGNGNGRRHG
ncbi:MAG TPA: hypothetical protein VMG40_17270 [Bryobacteraceae bacterium]|nr:hypothetical protein [Bryobacteraceae bacterium]